MRFTVSSLTISPQWANTRGGKSKRGIVSPLPPSLPSPPPYNDRAADRGRWWQHTQHTQKRRLTWTTTRRCRKATDRIDWIRISYGRYLIIERWSITAATGADDGAAFGARLTGQSFSSADLLTNKQTNKHTNKQITIREWESKIRINAETNWRECNPFPFEMRIAGSIIDRGFRLSVRMSQSLIQSGAIFWLSGKQTRKTEIKLLNFDPDWSTWNEFGLIGFRRIDNWDAPGFSRDPVLIVSSSNPPRIRGESAENPWREASEPSREERTRRGTWEALDHWSVRIDQEDPRGRRGGGGGGIPRIPVEHPWVTATRVRWRWEEGERQDELGSSIPQEPRRWRRYQLGAASWALVPLCSEITRTMWKDAGDVGDVGDVNATCSSHWRRHNWETDQFHESFSSGHPISFSSVAPDTPASSRILQDYGFMFGSLLDR